MKNVVKIHQNCYMLNKNCQPDSFASLDEVQIGLIKVNCVELMTFVNCLIPLGITFLN